ncbi:MAG: MoxR family ATPase [Candidatus Tantalella remota]|nr:MoxR family ATPase [Candidatus Tantalella remota]
MSSSDRDKINEKVKKESKFVKDLKEAMGKVIVGQEYLVDRLMIGLLANGHLLVESVPGLAKTLSIMTLSGAIKAKFQRIQFTPDLLPADILGTLIYNQKEGTFETKKGPIFANIVLADEVNRAPGKVQAALLEAMQERQVTLGNETHKLEEPFLVMATQNPIDQEGTYPLPEAQVDRFMLKVNITYPTPEEETEILTRMGHTKTNLTFDAVVTPQDILRAREVVDEVHLDDKIKQYIISIVFATRYPKKYKLEELENLIQLGASPRASIALILASKAYAFLQGRGYVTPQDIKSIGYDVLRHRIMPSYEAEAEEITTEDIIKTIFEKIQIP